MLTYIVPSIMVFICVASASLACGLTQGLLSLNPLEVNIKMRSGSPTEMIQAKSVLPLIQRHHLLLVTLMLFNSAANEALPLFLDQLVPTWLTIIVSVTLVLMFGEIIPSAIFTGPDQLKIASWLSTITWVLITVLYPIAYPISIILDKWLGHDDGMTIFNRREIYTMMQIQHEEAPKRGVDASNLVLNDEVTMIGGALKLRDKCVQDVMTTNVFMLEIDEKLTIKTLYKIFNSGCSRVPIYESNRNNIMGLMLVKDLLFIDPEDAIPIRNFMKIYGRKIESVWPDDKLFDVLKLFKRLHTHMAVVKDVVIDEVDPSKDPFYHVIGIITMEDIFEEILGDEILDETDTDDLAYKQLLSHHDVQVNDSSASNSSHEKRPRIASINVDFLQLIHADAAPTSSYAVDVNSKYGYVDKLESDVLKQVISYFKTNASSEMTQLFNSLGFKITANDKYSSQVGCLDQLIENLIQSSSTRVMSLKNPSNLCNVDSTNSYLQSKKETTDIDSNTTLLSSFHADNQKHKEYLYKKDKVANACTLILAGTVTIIDEFDNILSKGSWELLGLEVLTDDEGAWISNLTCYVSSPDFRCLRIMKPTNASQFADMTSSKNDTLLSFNSRHVNDKIKSQIPTAMSKHRTTINQLSSPLFHTSVSNIRNSLELSESLTSPSFTSISETPPNSNSNVKDKSPEIGNSSKNIDNWLTTVSKFELLPDNSPPIDIMATRYSGDNSKSLGYLDNV